MKYSKFLFWTPRILTVLFALFLMIFSLDVFEGSSSAGEIAIGLFMHNIPSFGILLFLYFSWKKEYIGAIVYPLLGCAYIFFAWGRFDILAYIFISGPLFIMGFLFYMNWRMRKSGNDSVPPGAASISSILIILLLSSCASSKSDLGLAYKGEVKRNLSTEKVSVYFVFSHIKETVGLDAIPKLENRFQRLNGFDDIFYEAQKNLSNVGKFATYIEEADDVNNPKKRAEKDSLMKVFDYTVKIRIEKKNYFSRMALGTIFSTLSVTLIPVPYTKYYSVKTEILDSSNKLISEYSRNFEITNWWQMFLCVVYPFHPETRKTEEMYLEFLKDIFRQIESEGIFKKL